MKYVERTRYLERLRRLQGTPDIKIITGLRRSGKSELMAAFIREIEEADPQANVIFVDFYDLDFEHLKDYHALHDFAKQNWQQGMANYLFVDEVQLCPDFELAINSLHSSGKFDIYITGSNAFLLSSDLTTLFTGRFIEIPVFPFSFSEFCSYFSNKDDTRALFDDYVRMGGLAGSYEYRSEIDRVAYVKDVYATIINRDLVEKYSLSDTSLLAHLAEFLMDNVSNLTSPNKVSDVLSAHTAPTNHVTVGKYIRHLCAAFMFYPVKRYDIRGKKYLETAEKYYLGDMGFRSAVLGTRNADYGRACENIVALELLRRGYELYVGKLYQKEIDFVAIRQSEKIYIQVSDNITEKETLRREVEPLLKIKDAYPKILLANTWHPEYQIEGVRVVNIADWLLGDETSGV